MCCEGRGLTSIPGRSETVCTVCTRDDRKLNSPGKLLLLQKVLFILKDLCFNTYVVVPSLLYDQTQCKVKNTQNASHFGKTVTHL